ncbi:hypothetical protein N7510_011102 [Penicillium lagena]|uniref:uncharacterized protein n=1 Tax=Penicillium lagena TaxID=94218 RepID=UPI00254131F8|nr:uncharacterized protein N7510_011102 [Penicillium lagena]KAJ5601568.1 hypothetical protein N7510_011102 [Penicillium lagena]
MAESRLVQSAFPASETSQVRSEHSPSVLGPLNTTQTDSGPLSADKPDDGATIVNRPTTPKPAEGVDSTLSMAQPPAGSTPGIATPPAGSHDPSREATPSTTTKAPDAAEVKKEEASTGEKRALDSGSAAPVTTSGTDKPPAGPEEPEVKKPKIDTADSDQSVIGMPAPAASTSGENHGQPKKTSRPKKEKIKDALKKAIPSDGIGSRTRSRTNGT